MRIERHPAVIADDLPGIYAHIARDNPDAAERVLEAVAETLEHIATQPGCGVFYPTHNPCMKNVQMLPVRGFSNYLIFYRQEADAVRILYIVHGARHLPHLFGREQRS